MKELNRVKDLFLWIPIDKRIDQLGLPLPPRKPETRLPKFWLARDGNSLYFINNTEEILDSVSVSTGGFQTCDDVVLTVSSEEDYFYENVMPNEAVKIEEYHPIFDSDFIFEVVVIVKSKNEGNLIIKSPPEKGGVKEAVLLWNTGEVGRFTSITRI